MTLEPIASAMAVLNEEEKQAGVVLVDIGGGTTDITIFYEGIIRHTSVIPLGGNIVTKDIKEGCTVMPSHAENLKTRFGSALSDEVFENRIISIPGLRGREHKEISEKNLSLIIQARMEEILDYVFTEISNSGYGKKLVAGIVLTGGGALLRHVDKLAELHTGLPTRIGLPVEHLAHGYSETLCSPIYATAIGLLLRGIEDRENGKYKSPEKVQKSLASEEIKVENDHQPKGGIINIIIEKTREWFDSEPDSDL
jgi:cell division protein FtsA